MTHFASPGVPLDAPVKYCDNSMSHAGESTRENACNSEHDQLLYRDSNHAEDYSQ